LPCPAFPGGVLHGEGGSSTTPEAPVRLHRPAATQHPPSPRVLGKKQFRGFSSAIANIRGLITGTNRFRACQGSSSKWERVGVGKGKAPSVTGLPGKTQRVCQLTRSWVTNSLGERAILPPNYIHKAKLGPNSSSSVLLFICSPSPSKK